MSGVDFTPLQESPFQANWSIFALVPNSVPIIHLAVNAAMIALKTDIFH